MTLSENFHRKGSPMIVTHTENCISIHVVVDEVQRSQNFPANFIDRYAAVERSDKQHDEVDLAVVFRKHDQIMSSIDCDDRSRIGDGRLSSSLSIRSWLI